MTDRTGMRQPSADPRRVAVVGCGAVAQLRHLPALAGRADRELFALVDTDDARVRRLAAEYGVQHALTDHRDLLDLDADAAVVAVPTNLHAPVTVDLLRAGLHVLLEKPIARSLDECDAMISAAGETGAVLAVAFFRRFAHQLRLTKRAIETGLLGEIRSFDIRDGYEFGWPVKTDFPFRRDAAGGGVFIDLGAHVMDLVTWWFGDAGSLEYWDNDRGGVESDCLLRITMATGAEGVVEISRTRLLRNTAIIVGERGTLEVDLNVGRLVLSVSGGPLGMLGSAFSGDPTAEMEQEPLDLFVAEQEDWLQAIRTGRAPEATAEDARQSLAVILDCYARRQPLELPWMQPEATSQTIEEAVT